MSYTALRSIVVLFALGAVLPAGPALASGNNNCQGGHKCNGGGGGGNNPPPNPTPDPNTIPGLPNVNVTGTFNAGATTVNAGDTSFTAGATTVNTGATNVATGATTVNTGATSFDGGDLSNLGNQSNANTTNVAINEEYAASTAYSAPLTAGEDTCMGSSSMGGQAVGFGLTIGTTWTDDNCRRLKNSRQLVALGFPRAATALMCIDPDVRNAMIQAGTGCPGAAATASVERPQSQVRQVTMAPIPTTAQIAPVATMAPVTMAPIPNPPARKRRSALLQGAVR